MENLLKVNIRQFDEGEGEGTQSIDDDFSKYIQGGSLDVDALVNDFKGQDSELEEQSPTDESEGEGESNPQETEGEGDSTPEGEGELDKPTDESEGESEEKPSKRTADQAFAEMRRQLESYEPLAQWVQQLAEQQGFKNPQELIDAYNEQRLAKEAQEKGVPLDVYKRLNQLEEENKRAREQALSEKFNREVEETKQKYKLSDDDLNKVFQFMGQNGYVGEDGAPVISFEDAYILANRDTIIQQAEERGRQAYLEEKEKLQNQATPNIKTNALDTQHQDELDYSTEGILKKFTELGIDID